MNIKIYFHNRLDKKKLGFFLKKVGESGIRENELYHLIGHILLEKGVFEPAGAYSTGDKEYIVYRHKKGQRFIIEKAIMSTQEEKTIKEKLLKIIKEENLELI